MSREWKPGDVALVPGVGVSVMSKHGWLSERGRGVPVSFYDGVRPLVVIDPEGGADLERVLTSRLRSDIECILRVSIKDDHWMRIGESLQTALRSLVAVTEPEEPTGLGAVVESADGRQWVRCLPDGGPAKWRLVSSHSDADPWFVWSAIPPVTILSPGWEPEQ